MISKARNALFAVALFAIGASANAVPIVDGNVDSRSVTTSTSAPAAAHYKSTYLVQADWHTN